MFCVDTVDNVKKSNSKVFSLLSRGNKINKYSQINNNVTWNSPKYENEQNQERKEYRDVVHCSQHDK